MRLPAAHDDGRLLDVFGQTATSPKYIVAFLLQPCNGNNVSTFTYAWERQPHRGQTDSGLLDGEALQAVGFNQQVHL